MLTAWEISLIMLAKFAPSTYSLVLNVEFWNGCDCHPLKRQHSMMQVLHPLMKQLLQIVTIMN